MKLERDKLSAVLAPLVVLAAAVVVFLPSVHHDFLTWDDSAMLVGNLNYRGLGLKQLGWMFTTFYMGHYQPLSWVTFALDYLIWGMDPFGYHRTNVLLHAVNAVLFYFVALRILAWSAIEEDRGRLRCAACFAALLFAVHPLRVESVGWVTERRDVLSGAFFFLTILAYLRAATAPAPAHRRWLGWALVAYTLSLLSKATAMTLPAVLVLIDIFVLKRLGRNVKNWFDAPVRKIWKEKLPFVLLAVAAAVVAGMAQYSAGAMDTIAKHGLAHRLAQASFGLLYYVHKTFFPARVYPMYDLPTEFSPLEYVYVVSFLAVTAITAGAFAARRRWPALWASWVYYAVLLAPVSGVAQSGSQMVADRYSYLSCLSWALLTAGFGLYLWRRREVGNQRSARYALGAAAVVACLALAWLTQKQLAVWRDSETLYEYVFAHTPRPSKVAFNNYGGILAESGRVDQATTYYRRALEIDPLFDDARLNLANALATQGKTEEAIIHYRETVRRNPNSLVAHHSLGLALVRRGDIDAALEEYRRALEIDSSFVEGHSNFGLLLAAKGRYAEAIVHFRKALELKPDFAVAHVNWGDTLVALGQRREAIEHFRLALKYDPNLASARESLDKALAAAERDGAAVP